MDDTTEPTDQYQVLRQATGLIDYAGAGLFTCGGPAAAAFLGRVATRSVDFLLEGQISTALLLNGDGTVLAEVLIHCRGTEYLLEVWPSQAEAVRDYLSAAAADTADVTFADVSADYRVFGIEGPECPKVIQKLLPFSVASMAYRSFVTVDHDGDATLLISRTGVTGEYGYKVHAPDEAAGSVRQELESLGAQECGRDALDICRMETRFVNLEREGAGGLTPFEYGLQWMVDMNGDFVGRDALLAHWRDGVTRTPVCWVGDQGGTAVPAAGAPVTIGGEEIGTVAYAVYSPSLGRTIGTARVEPRVAASGLELTVDATAVRTVSAPFLVATSFGVPLE